MYDPYLNKSEADGHEEMPDVKAKNDIRREFGIAVVKTAVFCVVLLLGDTFLYQPVVLLFRYLIAGFNLGGDYNALYFLSWLANDISVYLFPFLAAFFLFRKDTARAKPYPKKQNFRLWLMMPLVFAASCFAGSVASIITDRIAALLDMIFGTGEIADAMTGSLPQTGTVESFVIFLFFTVIAAPICEEIIFRKLLLQPLRRYGDGFAIVCSAVIFGVFHGNFDQLPYAVTVALLYGLLAVGSNSVIPTMILHFINNALVSLGSYLTQAVGETETTLAVTSAVNIVLDICFFLGIPALVLIFALKAHRSERMPLIGKKEKAKALLVNPAFYIMLLTLALIMAA